MDWWKSRKRFRLFLFNMTTKEQNEGLWRAIDNYFGWLIEQENTEYDIAKFEGDDSDRAAAYSNASMQLFEFLKEENLYEIISEKYSW